MDEVVLTQPVTLANCQSVQLYRTEHSENKFIAQSKLFENEIGPRVF